jgi:hypothetical protein
MFKDDGEDHLTEIQNSGMNGEDQTPNMEVTFGRENMLNYFYRSRLRLLKAKNK